LILRTLFELLYLKGASEQRPPVNNDHYFRVPWVVVEHRFVCTWVRADHWYTNIPFSVATAAFVVSSEDLIWLLVVSIGIRNDPITCLIQSTSHWVIRNQIASKTIKLATFLELGFLAIFSFSSLLLATATTIFTQEWLQEVSTCPWVFEIILFWSFLS